MSTLHVYSFTKINKLLKNNTFFLLHLYENLIKTDKYSNKITLFLHLGQVGPSCLETDTAKIIRRIPQLEYKSLHGSHCVYTDVDNAHGHTHNIIHPSYPQ